MGAGVEREATGNGEPGGVGLRPAGEGAVGWGVGLGSTVRAGQTHIGVPGPLPLILETSTFVNRHVGQLVNRCVGQL